MKNIWIRKPETLCLVSNIYKLHLIAILNINLNIIIMLRTR